jgi:hypothetical protein
MPFAAANPVRLVALVGVVAVLGVGIFVMKGLQGENETAAQPHLLHTTIGKHAKRHAPAAGKKTHRPARKPVNRSPVAANGFPRSVADALLAHAVVVVSVVAPRGRVDELSVREAQAGAAAAGAGFVRINAFNEAQIAPLDAKIDVHGGNPVLIVIRRPGDVSLQVDGFVDRDTIIQAVTDAKL